jgi:hypothetical protein
MTRLDLMKSTANPKVFWGGGLKTSLVPLFLFPVYCFILTFDFIPRWLHHHLGHNSYSKETLQDISKWKNECGTLTFKVSFLNRGPQ